MHSHDEAEIRPAEHCHEMRGREGEHQIVGEIGHRLAHQLYQVAMVSDRSSGLAVGPAREQEEQEEAGDETLIERRQPRLGSGRVRVDQWRARTEHEQQPKGDNCQHREAGPAQPLALGVGDGTVLLFA